MYLFIYTCICGTNIYCCICTYANIYNYTHTCIFMHVIYVYCICTFTRLRCSFSTYSSYIHCDQKLNFSIVNYGFGVIILCIINATSIVESIIWGELVMLCWNLLVLYCYYICNYFCMIKQVMDTLWQSIVINRFAAASWVAQLLHFIFNPCKWQIFQHFVLFTYYIIAFLAISLPVLSAAYSII